MTNTFAERDLAGAVDRREIQALYQPQVDARTGKVVAVEALSRWVHPELGVVMPNEFIPLAEDTGVIGRIGAYMLDDACRCAVAWRDRGTPVAVAVNVSAAQLSEGDLVGDVLRTLDAHGLDPEAMTVEITESRAIAEIAAVAERLEGLRSVGVGVALDDFGAGFATIAHLDALPITELKIDRSLVQSTPDDGRLNEAIAVGSSRGLVVVAEGVETDAQYDRVVALGCTRIQGFLVARPMPAEVITTVLSA